MVVTGSLLLSHVYTICIIRTSKVLPDQTPHYNNPEYFKRPHGLWSVVPPPKRRLLQHHTPSDDGQVSVSDDDDSQILLSQDDPRLGLPR